MTVLSINIVGEQIAVEGLISPSNADGRFKIKLPETLIESLALEEFRWYIEDYARKDPFALERARSAKLSLDSYGSSLADAVCCSDDVCADLLDSDLVILLNVGEDCPLEISRIHWELLENLDFWTRVRPRKVSVLRIVTSKKPNNATLRSPNIPQERLGQQRILAVSARSNQKDDIPHRLITRPILDVVREKQCQTIAPPTLEIVRPGTFEALVAVLESHDVGYFDVVHFDVHGFVSREG